MDHRIGRIHNRYRLLGVSAPAPAVASRLDRVVAASLPEALGRALGSALGDDPTVYVLRRVHARLTIRLDGAESDASLAEAWGARLASSIVRAIDEGVGTGEIARFDDRADHAAAFAADLLAGRAWDRWYYDAFASLRGLPVAEAMAALLLEHRDVLPTLLARLQRSGTLDAALDAVATRPDAARAVRDAALGREPGRAPGSDPDTSRPLFTLAARLLARLGLRPPGAEASWPAYRASGPPEVDWRDRDSLTGGVADALRFLLDRGQAERTTDVPTAAAVAAALDDLSADWIDAAPLARSLARMLRPEGRPAVARGATPAQRGLLAAIREAVAGASPSLASGPVDAPANALRVVAALVARRPDLAGDPAASALIATLLAASAALSAAGSPRSALGHLRRGDLDAALGLIGAAAPAAPLRALLALGEPAFEVASALLDRASSTPAIETQAAGLFFLVRAVLDLRLAAIHRAAGADFPGFPALLAALALRWSGLGGDPLDPGIAVFAGLDGAAGPGDLAREWSDVSPAALGRFQEALLGQLVGARMLDPAALVTRVEPGPGGTALLVAGDPDAGLWALGRAIGPGADIGPILDEWSGLVGRATGVIPAWTVGEGPSDSWASAVAAFGGIGDGPEPLEAWPTVTLAAIAGVRAWARWLGRFAGSGAPYLAANFLRRPGRIEVDPAWIEVSSAPGPLDIVLDLATYRAAVEAVPWLGGRRVSFRSDRGATGRWGVET